MTPSRGRRLASTLLPVLMVAGGCGDGGDAEIIPAPIHDLAEPWQAQPFAIDPSLVTLAEQICRQQGNGIVPPGSQLVVVDARGANRLTLLFAGPKDNGQCFLTRDTTGRLMTTGGEGTGGSDAWPELRPTEVSFNGVGSEEGTPDPNDASVSTSHLVGRAGIAVVAAEVVLPSGRSLRASLNRGWFAAWWPGLDLDSSVVVRGYDGAGHLVGSSP